MSELFKCISCNNEYEIKRFTNEKNNNVYHNCFDCRKKFINDRDIEAQKQNKIICISCKLPKEKILFYSNKNKKMLLTCFECRKTYCENNN